MKSVLVPVLALAVTACAHQTPKINRPTADELYLGDLICGDSPVAQIGDAQRAAKYLDAHPEVMSRCTTERTVYKDRPVQ